MEKTVREDVRTRIAIIGAGVVVALVLLYVAHIFYLQSLLVVWGAAIMLGTYVYDRRAAREKEAKRKLRTPGEAMDDLTTLERRLHSDDMAARDPPTGSKEAAVQRGPGKSGWADRERALDMVREGAAGAQLRPLPRRVGFWERVKTARRERDHLLKALDEAVEVLKSETPDAARARMLLIAADLRAHHGALRESAEGRDSPGDYAAAWAVIYSVSRGTTVGGEVFRHVRRRQKGKLDKIMALAAARGVVTVPASGVGS